MADAHAHHKEPAQDGESFFTVSRVLTGLAIGAGVIGAGIMLAPHVLPALGITSPELAEEAALMIHNKPAGMAGALNSTIGLIPGIGSKLAEGGWFTAAVSASIGMGGMLLGNFIEKREGEAKGIKWGSAIKWGALITSALVALPTILTAIGTGIVYAGMALSDAGVISTASSNSIISNVYKTIGSIGGTYEHNLLGLGGLAAVVPHFLCCGAPLAPLAANIIGKRLHHEPEKKDTEERKAYKPVNKVMMADDPNHQLTPEQQQMVDEYNAAPAVKKPILQKWFKDNGFAPDFHSDGTMHLHQHTTGLNR